jgi:ribonuclease Z
MRPSFIPRLINPPSDDPGLYVPLLYEKRAFLFDIGESRCLSGREILKIDHLFISHTHMDHFAGFDRLLRLLLGRDKILHLYGPAGFLKNLEGKLSAYSWNLVTHYQNRFILRAAEVHPDHLRVCDYACHNAFIPDGSPKLLPFDGTLINEPSFSVSAVILDHGIPCLGFALTERFHINILKQSLEELNLPVGPWLKTFKNALYDGLSPDTPFGVPLESSDCRKFSLGELAEHIAKTTPGQKIAYITDTAYTPDNIARIIHLSKGADHLFIEGAFLQEDKEMAAEKRHLTAFQAGTLAALCRAKQFTVFHFSPRYTGNTHLLTREARKGYEETLTALSEA